jgi:hypothetical protein
MQQDPPGSPRFCSGIHCKTQALIQPQLGTPQGRGCPAAFPPLHVHVDRSHAKQPQDN